MSTCSTSRGQWEIDIKLLAGPAVCGPGKAGVVPGGVKSRTLLAALALDAGSAVSTERLMDYLWEREPPRSAHKNLQLYASRLRRCLDAANAGFSRLLVHVGHGYRLDVPPGAVDVLSAGGLLRCGVDRLRHGDPHSAVASLTAALAGWPVDGLVGLVPSGPATAVAALWRERRIAAVEHLASAKVELGAWEEAADILAPHASAHPTRESLQVLLMRALAHLGDRVGAIDTYRRLWRVLDADLGIRPGREARAVFEGLLSNA
ncbi:AfsR/SARP family transcriptional regulator [Saccharothrix sp. 6-C]|uniref:AfsR/SARP family transcriptional regulator n=1 Tax=Saccharothrix sp. 6-C TaxID=2781735 RepID=UPI0019173350|nr:AfsR/SARP family transcriptional regulator [Saccharothrix sp. 6-C]QQQ79258.1 AfsR/SARP family transcriptional regulator [Saccharothrix sp. 6-C]